MNVLVLTETLDAGGQVATAFATHESVHASNRLADYLNNVPQGRTVRKRSCWIYASSSWLPSSTYTYHTGFSGST